MFEWNKYFGCEAPVKTNFKTESCHRKHHDVSTVLGATNCRPQHPTCRLYAKQNADPIGVLAHEVGFPGLMQGQLPCFGDLSCFRPVTGKDKVSTCAFCRCHHTLVSASLHQNMVGLC